MKTEIKEWVKRIPVLGPAAQRVHHWLFPNTSQLSYWIDRYIGNEPIDVVQIGSNDGQKGDPIAELIRKNTNWRVYFVEPVPYLFDRLRENYAGHSRFSFVNKAVNDGSTQLFYWVSEEAGEEIEGLPEWYDELGSFDRSHIIKHLDGVLEPFIRKSEIKGITLEQLFDECGVEQLKLLHLDTEGYDWKILSQLDPTRFRPTVILFEHIHLNESDIAESQSFLKQHYYVFKFESDNLCVRKDIIKKQDLQKLSDRRTA